MKEIIISVAILAIIFSFCALTSHYADNIISEVLGKLSMCEDSIETENWPSAENSVKEAISFLKKRSHILESFIVHSELESISVNLATLEVSITEREKLTAKSSVRLIKERLLILLDSDKVALHNIL